jgi:FkbM family methyltransferase
MPFFKKYRTNKTLSFREQKFYVDESEVVSRYLKEINSFYGIIFDVGSFRGTSIFHFKDKNWEKHCFEPNKDVFKLLESNTKEFKNIFLNNIALDELPNKEKNFYTSNVSLGISSLLNFDDSHYLKDSVQTTTIKNYVELNNILDIKVLKIDVEGFDLNVLKGNDWNLIKPEIILIEFEFNKTKLLNFSPNDLANYLIDKGYSIYISEWYPIIKYGTQHSLKAFYPYSGRKIDKKTWGNFIAFKTKPNSTVLKESFLKCLKKIK